MQPGHYENLITEALRTQLQTVNLDTFAVAEQPLNPDRAALFLTRYLSGLVGQLLGQLAKNDEVAPQIELVNRLIGYLQAEAEHVAPDLLIEPAGALLRAVLPRVQVPLALQNRLAEHLDGIEPALRFSQSALFSGGNSEISLDTELRKEIATADSIDLIVSFVKWSGLRLLLPALEAFAQKGHKLRVLTTTYMGATDFKAVERLARLPGAEVRVSYNIAHERLHAKAYLFGRRSGLSTAYIGSSNMSRSALTSGLEWNVKLTAQDSPTILAKFGGTFETYWNSAEFEPFADTEEHRQKLREALKKAGASVSGDSETLPNFHLRPYPYQQEMLDRLATERAFHGRHRNLVVAATGTGKTVLAAFDYARFARQIGGLPRLLFVAHREEMLRQARATFRHILGEANFGELWVGGAQPTAYDHLFVSVQTFDAQRTTFFERVLTPTHFAFIIIDEVHHVAAASYRPLLTLFHPTILLGLTATPERADGTSILADFDDAIAAEIRLPEAIARGLLVPFQYFGVTDPVDYRAVRWSGGKYATEELTQLYAASKARTAAILDALPRYLLDPHAVRALVFCVSREHARRMADALQAAGYKAAYLASGDPAAADRLVAVAELRSGKLSYLCVVDLFNEGVDIPEVDTVVFLRPTESLTIFLQQLGRGLRLHESKECLTVLDFVGQARAEYSYEQRFRALVGRTGTTVQHEVETGFGHLPPGCSIQLEREAMAAILENIRAATGANLRTLVRRVEGFSFESPLPLTLPYFLAHTGFSMADIYRNRAREDRGWYAVKRRANVLVIPAASVSAEEAHLIAAVWRLAQLNAPGLIRFAKAVFDSEIPITDLLDQTHGHALGLMLHYLLVQEPGPKNGYATLADSLTVFRAAPTLATEAREVLEVCENRVEIPPQPLAVPFPSPLELHARYSRDEILCAVGYWTFERAPAQREGVLNLPALNAELLFVTLQKSAKDYSPSTLYHDYAISETLFHWESQNATGEETPKGRSYIEHAQRGKTILLFVREQNQTDAGLTVPYVCLGPVRYVRHQGSRPMQITWELATTMPGFLWHDAGKMAVG